MKTLIILDYNAGLVHAYGFEQDLHSPYWEEVIKGLGFNEDECSWMITNDPRPIHYEGNLNDIENNEREKSTHSIPVD
jgi:hypothetical protein